MSGIQWLLLILVVAAVAGAYWYLRRQGGDDPWQGMEDEPGGDGQGGDPSNGESGESYIVGVRTVRSAPGAAAAPEPPAGRGGNPEPKARPAAGGDDESFWKAFQTDAGMPEPRAEEAPEADRLRPQRPPAGEESLFVLHVASRDDSFFDGPDIHAALQAQKLKFGLHDIYHRITEVNGVPESVYSVANILKPGFLDPVEADHLRTPGLALFLVLPGPIEGTRAMRDMLDTAQALADELGGEVLDDKRSLLTSQTAQYMLDQVAELDRRQRLQASR